MATGSQATKNVATDERITMDDFRPGQWVIWRQHFTLDRQDIFHDVPAMILGPTWRNNGRRQYQRYSCLVMMRLPEGEIIPAMIRGEAVLLETPGIMKKPQIKASSLLSLDEYLDEKRSRLAVS